MEDNNKNSEELFESENNESDNTGENKNLNDNVSEDVSANENDGSVFEESTQDAAFAQDNTEAVSNLSFESEAPKESNMYGTGEKGDIKPDKKKKKVWPVILIIVGVLIALAAAFVIFAPRFLVGFGDAKLKEGNYKSAANYYKLCLGYEDTEKRHVSAKALTKIKPEATQKELEEAIKDLLEGGVKVKVKYDYNGGTILKGEEVNEVLLQEPEQIKYGLVNAYKKYYEFTEWKMYSKSYFPEKDASTFELSVKASYTLAEYEISYLNLYSDKVENPQKYTVETPTITLKNPTRTGYEFVSWIGTDINGSEALVVIPQGSYGERTYRAQWEPNQYVVTFVPDEDCTVLLPDGVEQFENPITITYDESYDLPSAFKRGYMYKGWTDGEKVYTKGVWKILADTSIAPVWEIINYQLSYNLAEGALADGVRNPETYTVVSEDILLNNPSRFGYSFSGWTSVITDGENVSTVETPRAEYVIANNSVGNIDFTAVWQGNPHRINLHTNGGTADYSVVNVVFGSEYSIPDAFRTGYTFKGWFDNNSNQFGSGVWSIDNDIDVYAKWTANQYNITFNPAGGTLSDRAMSVTFDRNYSLPSPTRYGYTFTGWKNGDADVASSGVWKLPNNVTLSAQWKGNPHRISLNNDGGTSSVSAVDVVFGNAYTLPTPEKKGHTFDGWFDGSNTRYSLSGTWNKDENVSLKAKWKVNKYNATLDVNGGSIGTRAHSVDYGTAYNFGAPTREGYTFDGWMLGTERIANSGTWSWDKNIALKANWKANTYKASFNANGGSVYPSTMNVTYDDEYRYPVPIKKGHSFEGWYNGSSRLLDGVWKYDENLSFTARWQVNTYTADIDAHGGTVNDDSIRCSYGSRYSLPTSVYRKGYTFEGWYNVTEDENMSSGGTWEWDHNIEVRALWDANKYDITLDPNGGSVSKTRMSVIYGKSYELPEPEMTGYEFVGWYNGRTEFELDGKWRYDDDVHLTAKWIVEEYEVDLDANGGTVSRDHYEIEYRDSYSFPTPTRKGYEFVGWYHNSTQISLSGTWTITRSVTLKAKWEPIVYSINLDANGGSVSKSVIRVEYGSSYSLPTPTRTGFEFEGWYIGSSRFSSDGKYDYDQNITVQARWEEIVVATTEIQFADQG